MKTQYLTVKRHQEICLKILSVLENENLYYNGADSILETVKEYIIMSDKIDKTGTVWEKNQKAER